MNSTNKSIEMNAVDTRDTRPSSVLVLVFLLVCLLPFAFAWDSVESLFRLVLDDSTFSQIPLIPVVSSFLVYEHRKAIFAELSFGWILGSSLIASGMILLIVARLNLWHLSLTNPLTLLVFAIFLIWLGSFALFFGPHAF